MRAGAAVLEEIAEGQADERAGRWGGDDGALVRMAHRVQPVALAREHVLPVLPAFEGLLPELGLRRGTVVRTHGPGATSLALALLAGGTQAGSWVAAIGVSGLGLGAAAELGVALERVLLVAAPAAEQWPGVVGAALDGVDALLVDVPRRVKERDARRLQDRLRDRGAVVVIVGAPGSFQPDLVLAGTRSVWSGLGRGWGHLQGRDLTVEVSGRRAASRRRTGLLRLPGPDGEIGVEQPVGSNVVALRTFEEAG
jgi:hypothetical protein